MTDKIILKMQNIRKSFPGVLALSDISFNLKEGEVHALLGENGAGKSTLIKILAGVYTPDSGKIFIDDKEVKIINTHIAHQLGISVIHQELCLATNMTVADNIFMGRPSANKIRLVKDKVMIEQTRKIMDQFGLEQISPKALVSSLTTAQRQMVEIAKALSMDARIIIMDEPTSSLTDKEVDKLFNFIKLLKQKNISIIYISHRLEEIFQICDRITVIRDGEYVGETSASATTKEELMSMMVGRKLNDVYPEKNKVFGDEVLRVENLTKDDKLKDISFDVRAKEILGFYGLIGSGRTEIMRLLFGIDSMKRGQVYLNKKEIHISRPKDAINAGIVLAPESRKEQGLILIRDIDYNITLSIMKKLIKVIKLNKVENDRIVDEYGNRLRIKTPSYKQKVINLSGGNQQKVVLAKWLATEPKVLILDEPTRGVDVGAKQEIYQLIHELALTGVSILLVSSELPEIIGLSNRVVVMKDFKHVATIGGEEISQENIIKLALEG